MKVVISGSRSIKLLPQQAIESIDKIIEQGFQILIGDAPGIDSLVQQYLKSKNYQNVVVYHAYQKPRNNAGFKSEKVDGNYTDRDKYMCNIADFGLAIWDGISKGTAANIKRVPKTKVIYVGKVGIINVGINILRHKDGYIGNPRIVYCGRPKSNKQWKLGNPFSWKRSQIARWVVKDISESLSKFKLFTWDLINERWDKFSPEDIDFAKQYWEEMKMLAGQIKRGEIDALTCFCLEFKNFVPVKGIPYECHTQILYAACLYMIEKEMV